MPSRTSCPQAPSAPRFEDGTPGPRLRPQPPRRTSPTSAPSVPAPESPERAKSKAPVISTHRVPGHARRHRVSARTRKPGVLHEVEDEANHPANLHLAPSGTYQPTAPRRARRIRGMRRAEQVISGLPPGPAANATRGPPRRAERRPPPSPRRAVPRRAHRAGFTHTDRSTRPAARCHIRAERKHRQDNPESRAEQQAITRTPSSCAPRRLFPPKGRRRRTNNLDEFSTKWRAMPTAPVSAPGAQRYVSTDGAETGAHPADHRAEHNADYHRVRTERYTSVRRHRAQRDSQTLRQSAGSAPATHRDEHLDEPTERTGPRMSSDTQNCPPGDIEN